MYLNKVGVVKTRYGVMFQSGALGADLSVTTVREFELCSRLKSPVSELGYRLFIHVKVKWSRC